MKTNYFKLFLIIALCTFQLTELKSQRFEGGPTYEAMGEQKPYFYFLQDLQHPLTFVDNGITYVACIYNGPIAGIDAFLDKYKMNGMKSNRSSGQLIKYEGNAGRGVFNDANTDLKVQFNTVYWSEKGTLLLNYPVIWVDNYGKPITSGTEEKSVTYGKWVTSYFEGPVIIKVKPLACNDIKTTAIIAANVGIAAAITFTPGVVFSSAVAGGTAVGVSGVVLGTASGFGVQALADKFFKENSTIYYGFLTTGSKNEDCVSISGDCVISKFNTHRTVTKCDALAKPSRGAAEVAKKIDPVKTLKPKKVAKAIKKPFKGGNNNNNKKKKK